MHTYRGLLSTYIWSNIQYMRPDDPNTLTHQSSGMYNAPREPLHGTLTWNPSRHGLDYVYAYGYVYSTARHHNHWEQKTLCLYTNILPIVSYYWPPQAPPSALAVSCHSLVLILFDSRFLMGFNLFFLTRFDSQFLTGSESGFLVYIQLTFNAFIFDSSHII